MSERCCISQVGFHLIGLDLILSPISVKTLHDVSPTALASFLINMTVAYRV